MRHISILPNAMFGLAHCVSISIFRTKRINRSIKKKICKQNKLQKIKPKKYSILNYDTIIEKGEL